MGISKACPRICAWGRIGPLVFEVIELTGKERLGRSTGSKAFKRITGHYPETALTPVELFERSRCSRMSTVGCGLDSLLVAKWSLLRRQFERDVFAAVSLPADGDHDVLPSVQRIGHR